MSEVDKLERFQAHGKEFLDVLSAIPEAHRYTTVDGGWSAAYVVHHMADAEVQFATRFMNALAEIKPRIVPFNEEVYPDSLYYAKRSVKISQDTCSAIGAFIISILENISEQDWGRISLHPDLGEMSISDLLAKVVSHYQAHIGQLKEIIESL